ncbi:MAG: alanine racemase [Bacilli bacterium]|nr:alanine racemase [Bacilli bacterium]
MQLAVDLNKIRDNIKENIKDKLFNWIDVRYNAYGLGLDILDEILKIDNIGVFTNNLSEALKIRNIFKKTPIIISEIADIEQIYDVIMNNLILVVKDYDELEEIQNLKIRDELQLFLQLNINNFEDGLSTKYFYKAMELIKYEKHFNLRGVYAVVNNAKHNSLDNLQSILASNSMTSFVIGKKCDFVSDGFLTNDVFDNATKSFAVVDKCTKLTKKDIFVDKKVRKECYGIKLKINGVINTKNNKFKLDDKIYKKINLNEEYLYLIGNEPLKVGKKIDLTNYLIKDSNNNWEKTYILNGKTVEYNNFN